MAARRRTFAPGKSKTSVPIGWTHVDIGESSDRHSLYRCPAIGSAIGSDSKLELRRCSFVCRKDRIPTHPSKRSPHVFDRPQEGDTGFPVAAQLKKDLRTQERFRNAIADAVALLSLQLQIPVNRISHPAFWEFVTSVMQIGESIGKTNVDQLLQGISAKAISERITHLGHVFRERDFATARELRYVNIVVDAGTVLGVATIHSLLTNPYHREFPIVLEITENDHFDKFMYRDLFERLCMICHEQDLIVCSIITDGLPAQVSGLEMLLQEKESCSCIYQIRCFAHLTNLVFNDCLKQLPNLKAMVRDISALVSLLRTAVVVEELREKCPAICPTRWLYLFDILMWLCTRKDKINAFLIGSDNNSSDFQSIPDEWQTLLDILRPLKLLSLAVESSGCALWEIIPLVAGVMKIWEHLIPGLDDDARDVLRIFVANFVWRFRRSSPEVAITSFTLTEQGREVLRRRDVGFQTRGAANVSCFTTNRIESLSNLGLECDGEEMVQEGERDSDSEPADEMVDDGMEMIVTPEFEEEEDIEGTDNLSKCDIFDLALEQLMKLDIYVCDYSTALRELIALGNRLSVPEDYIEEKFRSWIYLDRSQTPTRFCIGESPDTIWRRVPALCEEWRPFADISLRFVTIGTSEADCERSLSRQKDAQGLHTTNIRAETIEARLRA